MTVYDAFSLPQGEILTAVFMLLLIIAIALFFAALRDGHSRGIRTGLFVWFMCLFTVFYLIRLQDVFWLQWIDSSFRPPYDAAEAFGALPVRTLILYEAVNAVGLFLAYLKLRRWRSNHLGFGSIKETMDLLPVGIAYAKADGTVVFCNLVMSGLARTLTGKTLKDLPAFFEAAGITGDGAMLVDLPDGSAVWQFVCDLSVVDGETCFRLTASDVTAQAAVTRELKEKNRTLRDMKRRLELYNRQAEQIISAQELLTARMAVHSEVGNILLECRHYLNDPEALDGAVLLQALKNTNTFLLKEYEEDDAARDPLAQAQRTAQALGVEVEFSGVIPAEDPARSILAAAVNECASNTVKHAGGDCLWVDFHYEDNTAVIRVANNGKPPEGKVREGGGLRSLRTLAERAGGTMRTESAPGFVLTIRLPK